jgi:hypothetical protein
LKLSGYSAHSPKMATTKTGQAKAALGDLGFLQVLDCATI